MRRYIDPPDTDTPIRTYLRNLLFFDLKTGFRLIVLGCAIQLIGVSNWCVGINASGKPTLPLRRMPRPDSARAAGRYACARPPSLLAGLSLPECPLVAFPRAVERVFAFRGELPAARVMAITSPRTPS